MDFKKHLENAWNMTLKHLTSLVLVTLAMFIISGATLFILSPVMLAGYCQSIIEMMRNDREPRISDLFSQFQLFLPLLIFSLIILAVMLIGFTLLVLPGIAMACILIFACTYMLPLMTDQKLNLFDAIQKSWEMAVKENLPDHIVVVILIIGLTTIGGSVFVGMLFTQPFTTLFVLSIYNERIGRDTGAPPAFPSVLDA